MSDAPYDRFLKKKLESIRPEYHPASWTRFRRRLPGTPSRLPVLVSLLSLMTCLWMLFTQFQQQQRIDLLTERLASRPAEVVSGRDTVTLVREVVREVVRYVSIPDRQKKESDHLPAESDLSGSVKVTPVMEEQRFAASPDSRPAEVTATSSPDTLRKTPTLSVSKTKEKTRFHLSSLDPVLGLDGQVSGGSVALGPSVVLQTGNRLGVSFGVQVERFSTDRYRSTSDLNAATGVDFLKDYRDRLPDHYDRLEDLSLRTTLVSLPVMLRYQVPVSGRWSALLLTGSRLHLAGFRQVGFETHQGGEETYHFFESGVSVPLFRNLRFGAGLVYRKGRFAAEATPVYEYTFRSVPGLRNTGRFGVRASVGIALFPEKAFH